MFTQCLYLLFKWKRRWLKLRTQNAGYVICDIYKNKKKKTFTIHRLVAKAFIENINNSKAVNHKDGNKLNNHYSNLEWCSHSENTKHSYNTGLQKKTGVLKKGELKLSMDKIQELIYEKTVNNKTSTELCNKYNISYSTYNRYIKLQVRDNN